MKILLVVPSQSETYGRFSTPGYPPLGIAYLAAVLQQAGHIVRIIDIDAGKISEQDFVKDVKTEGYGLVGITTTTPSFHNAIRLAKMTKENSRAVTVLGGIHATVMPEESIRIDAVDFVVKGEGERTVIELVEHLASLRELESIAGIYYKQNGKNVKNKDGDLISDLDQLPFPVRQLDGQQGYTYPDTLYRRTFPIITSRGCPADCSYCNSKNLFGRKFRTRSPKNIVDEIEYLIKDFGAREIHVWDDNFSTIRKRVFEIHDEIKRRNVKVKFAFPDGIRADCVDEEVLKALKNMGTYSIAFGVESGNQGILDKVNKKIALEQIVRAFTLAKKIGLETWGFFMIGLPDETIDSIKDTIKFALKLNPDVAKFHILKPFPGSQVYKEFLQQGLLLDNDFNRFGIHTPPVHRLPDLSPEDLLYWHKMAYRRFYLRPSVILKHLLRLKSFYRLKINLSAAKGVLKNMWQNE